MKKLTQSELDADITQGIMDFSYLDLSGLSFKGKYLNYIRFRYSNLENCDFRNAEIYKASFTGASLSNSNFKGARGFSGTYGFLENLCDTMIFDKKIMELKKHRNTDFKKLLKRKALEPDALDMNNWHTCCTTHCLAGWASVLSNSTHLENRYPVYLIGWACLGKEWADMFYATDEEALEFLKKIN